MIKIYKESALYLPQLVVYVLEAAIAVIVGRNLIKDLFQQQFV